VLIAAPARRQRTEPAVADASIAISNLSFKPVGAKRPALSQVELTVKSGTAVAIVGPSGAGKSCLARLIVGARMPTEGQIAIGGLQTRHWSREMLGRQIGYLPQTVGLFPGTLRDNIARFNDCADELVFDAARRADVHDMILDLPDGYDTRVDDGGSGLSGGQRQRVGLARALFGKPRLIVLDEPNAHLDADGEEALANALRTLKAEGSTIVLIAHRLNPVAYVDRVIVLDKGRIQLDGARRTVFRKVRTHIMESIAAEPVGD